MAFFFIVCVLTVNAGAVSAQTAPTPDKPHAINGMPNMGKTGVIEGTVFTLDDKEQKTPISGQEITMVVLNNGQQVLTLKKTTIVALKAKFSGADDYLIGNHGSGLVGS